jgi:hypothetical protein
MLNFEPPVKKLRTAGGMGVPTVPREETDPTSKRKLLILKSVQWKNRNYRGVLQEYFQKQKQAIKPTFDTVEKSGSDPRAAKVFISTCKAGEVTATGEAGTKRKAIQQAALAVIEEMKLITAADKIASSEKNTDEKIKPKDPPPPKKKEKKPIIENIQYLKGNFRGALQEYLASYHPGVRLQFETEVQQSPRSRLFIAHCKPVALSGSLDEQFVDLVGIGHATSKKSAIHFSALEFMVKMNLLTEAKHFEIHHDGKENPENALVNNAET